MSEMDEAGEEVAEDVGAKLISGILRDPDAFGLADVDDAAGDAGQVDPVDGEPASPEGETGDGATGEADNPWGKVVGSHPEPGTISVSQGRQIHILYGDDEGMGGHIYDSGMPGKAVFPEDWDEQKIISEVEGVANHPDGIPVEQSNGNFIVTGTRDGVDITVIVKPDGEVATAYPTGGQGVARNDANGDPHPL
jgi:hypothetical protein